MFCVVAVYMHVFTLLEILHVHLYTFIFESVTSSVTIV